MKAVSSINIASLVVLVSVIALLTSESHYEPLVQKYEEKQDLAWQQKKAEEEAMRNNYLPVDLGLSVKWSSKIYEDGDREVFAWGPGWSSCISEDISKDLSLADDPVYEDLNGKWRMPTADEIRELAEKCEWYQEVVKNEKGKVKKEKGLPVLAGFKVVGPNGNTLYIHTRHEVSYHSTSPNSTLIVKPELDDAGKIVVDGRPALSIRKFDYDGGAHAWIRPVLVETK